VPERYTETPLRPGPVLQNRHNIKLKEVLLAVWPLRWLIVGIFEVPGITNGSANGILGLYWRYKEFLNGLITTIKEHQEENN